MIKATRKGKETSWKKAENGRERERVRIRQGTGDSEGEKRERGVMVEIMRRRLDYHKRGGETVFLTTWYKTGRVCHGNLRSDNRLFIFTVFIIYCTGEYCLS